MATVITSIGTALGSNGSGVVTLTSGSTTVTGQGTFFTTSFTGGTAPPQAIEIPIGGGTYYTVKSVESNTELTLVSDPGVSASMQSWKVGTRDYSSIAAWDADLDNTAIYSSSDTGQGECYADSAFSQSGYQRLDGGITVGLSKIILTVPVGQRHDGTADSGAKVNLTSGGRFVLWYQPAGGPPRTMEWLELDGGDSEQNFDSNAFVVGISTAGQPGTVSHLLVHGCHNNRLNNGNMLGIIAGNVSQPAGIFNNIVYDCSGRLQTPGISSSTNGIICNNTVYKIGMTYTSGASDGSREAIGILCGDNCVIKNNIAIGTYFADDGHDHEKYDYLVTGAGTVGTYNISGDSTASGSDSITGVTTASLFISTTSGSEDLHILRSSPAVGAGEDLGTSVTSGSATLGGSTYGSPINRDINNGDRNAFAMAWDIGASQNSFISTIGTALGSVGSGTVTLTSGSTSVTGVNTNFTSAFTGGTAPPQVVEIPSGGGTYYTVKSVENDTTLTLTSDPGVSAGSQSWKVGTRDYSSVAVWEADLDDADYYGAGSTVRGECYDDSDFSISAAITVDGGGTVGLDAVILSVAAGQRHDGTAKEVGGSGVRFLWAAPGDNARSQIALKIDEAREAWVEWIDFDVNGYGLHSGSMVAALQLHGGQYYTAGYANGAAWCIVHDNTGQQTVGSGDHTFGIIATGRSKFIVNCIVYNMSNKGYEDCFGIYTDNQDAVVVCNNTVYNIHGFDNSPALSDAIGFSTSTRANAVYRNNISARVYEATSTKCYGSYSGGDINNLSTDDTADGTNSIADVDYTTLFHSTTAGAEDLHILRSSKAVGAGTDLGTHLTFWPGESGYEQNVPVTAGLLNRDINHGDRNSRAMAWDIGASQNAIVSTIGTTGREYSTVAAWTADLDEDTYYGAGSVARGECYADTAFTACHLENGGTIGLVRAVLTAADGQQHDGTAGTGVVFNMAGEVNRTYSGSALPILSFLEFTQSSTYADHDAVDAYTAKVEVDHCLIHGYDLRQANSASACLLRQGSGDNGKGRSCHNNILYDVTRGIVGSQNCTLYGIKQKGAYAATTNNTAYNIHADSTDGSITQNAIGIEYERTYHKAINNIAMGISSANGTATGMVCDKGSPSEASNNMVNDTSETGGSSQTGKSSSGQFVSTTTGSEDLHLVVGSDAIGNGADLGVEIDTLTDDIAGTSQYVWGLNYDINRGNRDAFSQTWDIGASQYEIIAKIGTSSRDFSTIDAWEAQLDNTDYYGKGSKVRGECYDDTDFPWSSSLTIDGGGTVVLDQVVLSVAAGQRHDGTAKEVGGSGVRLLVGADQSRLYIAVNYGGCSGWVEWLDFDGNNYAITTQLGEGMICANAGNWYSAPRSNGIANCIIHDNKGPYNHATRNATAIGASLKYDQNWITNCIIYNIGAQWYIVNDKPYKYSYGLYTGDRDGVVISNITIYNIFTTTHPTSNESNAYGWYGSSSGSYMKERNVIAARVYGGGNVNKCFGPTGGPSDYNLSTDDTAIGSNSVHDVDYNDLFVSISAGAEDLLLKDGSPALRAGDDMGNGPIVFWAARPNQAPPIAGILPVDIKGRDRHAEDDTWDIGAHQCEDCSEGGAVTNTAFMFFVD